MEASHTVFGALLILGRQMEDLHNPLANSKGKGPAPARYTFSKGIFQKCRAECSHSEYIPQDVFCCERNYFKFEKELVRTGSCLLVWKVPTKPTRIPDLLTLKKLFCLPPAIVVWMMLKLQRNVFSVEYK